jgi:membrane-associated phospholipid phosphatase
MTKKTGAKKNIDKVERVDRAVAQVVGKKRNSVATKTLGHISDLADQPPLIAISSLTIVAGLLSRDRRLANTGIRMLASHWLATEAKSFVKRRIDRTRPFVMLNGGDYHAVKGGSAAKRENSFPSGHTAGAVAVARAVAREYPQSGAAGNALSGAAALLQLPRAAHFASDIVMGGLIGLAAEATIALVLPVRPEDKPAD